MEFTGTHYQCTTCNHIWEECFVFFPVWNIRFALVPDETFHRERRDRRHPGVENMNVAVMGCVVNGPGESKHANIGISLPGTGERPVAPVYIDGDKSITLKGDHIAQEFMAIVEGYVSQNYRS